MGRSSVWMMSEGALRARRAAMMRRATPRVWLASLGSVIDASSRGRGRGWIDVWVPWSTDEETPHRSVRFGEIATLIGTM